METIPVYTEPTVKGPGEAPPGRRELGAGAGEGHETRPEGGVGGGL